MNDDRDIRTARDSSLVAIALLSAIAVAFLVVGGTTRTMAGQWTGRAEIAWFVFVGTLALRLVRRDLENVWDYLIALSLIGAPCAIAEIYSQLSRSQACWHCVVIAGVAMIVGTLAMLSPGPTTPLRLRLTRDARALVRWRTAITVAVFCGVCFATVSATESVAVWRVTLTSRPNQALVGMPGFIKVVVFSDYQCPSCAARHRSYDRAVQEMSNASSGRIIFEHRDYPLDTECNSSISVLVHPAACEAAVLARVASRLGQGAAAADFLYDHFSTLTAESVEKLASDLGIKQQYQESYETFIEEIRKDVELGDRVGVDGTPTYFVNGAPIANTMSTTQLRWLVRIQATGWLAWLRPS